MYFTRLSNQRRKWDKWNSNISSNTAHPNDCLKRVREIKNEICNTAHSRESYRQEKQVVGSIQKNTSPAQGDRERPQSNWKLERSGNMFGKYMEASTLSAFFLAKETILSTNRRSFQRFQSILGNPFTWTTRKMQRVYIIDLRIN